MFSCFSQKLWLQAAPPLTLNDCAQLAHTAPQVAVKFFWLITPWKAWRWRIFERPKLSVLRWFRDINYTSIPFNTMMIPWDSRMVIVIPGYSTVNHGEWHNHTVLICFIPAADGNDEWHHYPPCGVQVLTGAVVRLKGAEIAIEIAIIGSGNFQHHRQISSLFPIIFWG